MPSFNVRLPIRLQFCYVEYWMVMCKSECPYFRDSLSLGDDLRTLRSVSVQVEVGDNTFG